MEAYFRKTGKQRAHVWMSGFVHADGYGADERVQFGQREAPVLCGRQSCFLMWAVRRELQRFDGKYPTREPAILAWLAMRRASAGAVDESAGHGDQSTSSCDAPWRWAALFFTLMYVDDVGG